MLAFVSALSILVLPSCRCNEITDANNSWYNVEDTWSYQNNTWQALAPLFSADLAALILTDVNFVNPSAYFEVEWKYAVDFKDRTRDWAAIMIFNGASRTRCEGYWIGITYWSDLIYYVEIYRFHDFNSTTWLADSVISYSNMALQVMTIQVTNGNQFVITIDGSSVLTYSDNDVSLSFLGDGYNSGYIGFEADKDIDIYVHSLTVSGTKESAPQLNTENCVPVSLPTTAPTTKAPTKYPTQEATHTMTSTAAASTIDPTNNPTPSPTTRAPTPSPTTKAPTPTLAPTNEPTESTTNFLTATTTIASTDQQNTLSHATPLAQTTSTTLMPAQSTTTSARTTAILASCASVVFVVFCLCTSGICYYYQNKLKYERRVIENGEEPDSEQAREESPGNSDDANVPNVAHAVHVMRRETVELEFSQVLDVAHAIDNAHVEDTRGEDNLSLPAQESVLCEEEGINQNPERRQSLQAVEERANTNDTPYIR